MPSHQPADGGTPSALLLVRCWLEPASGGAPVVRGTIRDVRSGEVTPIGDVAAVEAHVRRRLRLPDRGQLTGGQQRIA